MEDKYSKNQDLRLLALNVNKEMTINKILHQKYENYIKYNTLSMDIMGKCVEDKNTPSIKYFNEYSEIVQKEYDNLKSEIEKKNLKLNSLQEHLKVDLSLERTLNNKQDENFVLSHLIIEKNCIINSLKKSIKLSKDYYLSREKIRDTFIDAKSGKRELEKLTNELHQNMLYEFKGYNKMSNLINEYESEKKVLLKNIELLKLYNKKFNIFNKKRLRTGIIFYEDKEKEKAKLKVSLSERVPKAKLKGSIINKNSNNTHTDIIGEFPKIRDLFDFSSEEGENENIIDEELHSDDDNNFINNIQPKKRLSTHYIKQIKEKIPRFNFDQINFNKSKAYVEIDMYSLERRDFKYKNIDFQINEIKKRKKLLEEKIELLKKKDIAMKLHLIKFKQKLEELKSLVYQKTQIDVEATSDFIFKSLKNMLYNNLEHTTDGITDENDKTYESIILDENDKDNLIFDSIKENENEDENEDENENKNENKNENENENKN